ncbi:MAG TPA: stage II sporulation protein M [Solirubrobacteraceae bacterium]|nr:stage II sporulation protein M [Solirubrobacteraceae bacterium]
MSTEQLAFVQGWDDTRSALRRWRSAPLSVLSPWVLGAFAVAVALLVATYVVARLSTPDTISVSFPGYTQPATAGDLLYVLERNALVLALHAMACVAGFMAGSSMPQVAEGYSGIVRRIHQHAGPAAILFVCAAVTFSLGTQAYALGHQAANLSALVGHGPGLLIVTLLPHALPELTALFLPLAAWTIASRRGDWQDLLAATFVTVAIAVPVLVATGVIETYVTPAVMRALL